MLDLCIIGGGPAGYHAAALASKGGMEVLLFEKALVGGVCLNEGCIPTKALLYSAKLYDLAKGGAAPYGVRCGEVTIDYPAAVARKDKLIKKLRMGVEGTLKEAGVRRVNAVACLKGCCDGVFTVEAVGEQYRAKNVLVCTGSRAAIPPAEGLAQALERGFALTNREALALTLPPERMVIVGGGVIGLEMASLFASLGTQVTVLEMTGKLGGGMDAELSVILQGLYEKKGVRFLLNAVLTAVGDGFVTVERCGEVTAERCGEVVTVECDKVLVSTGRKPNVEGLGLESVGAAVVRGALETDAQMRTNVPRLYAAGDVNGRSMLAHTAYREAEAAVNQMLGREDGVDYGLIPSVVYTNPEAAWIGENAESAAAKGISFRESRLPMQYSGRFQAENERGTGLVKLLWDEDKLIGAHLLGNPASEIVSTLSAAMTAGMDAAALRRIVFPHPSVGEILHDLFYI